MPVEMRIKDARLDFEETPFRAPLKFGGRIVAGSQLVHVALTVETTDGRRGEGAGSMPLGNVWGWPSSAVEPGDTAEAARRLARAATEWVGTYPEPGHPLDIGLALEHEIERLAAGVTFALGLPERMPRLMALVAASAVDAALHDAYGKALGRNVYDCYGPDFVRHDLSRYLTPEFRGEYLDRSLHPAPRPTLPLYHLVGALDPLTSGEVTSPIGDGLPEDLGGWIERDGLTHLKIKLAGDDLDWDTARVVGVGRVADASASRRGIPDAPWHYSLDFNERCRDADYVLALFDRLQSEAPGAMGRVRYVEQPTARDLTSPATGPVHRVAAIRPVVIDESLTGLESLLRARELGYSGIALKTCKGHGQALLLGAYAQKAGLFLCVQDLTCPGTSFLHSAGLAARIPGVDAIEGNGRQYCPGASRGWDARYPDLFRPRDGAIRTGLLIGPGLGH